MICAATPKKMRAALPVGLFLIYQSKVDLVDHRGGL